MGCFLQRRREQQPGGPNVVHRRQRGGHRQPVRRLSTTTASPAVAVGGTIHDTAMLGGFEPHGHDHLPALGTRPTTFCGSTPAFTATVAVNAGSGNYPSPNFTPIVAGTYRWQAIYSGDANNKMVPISACLDPNESVIVDAGHVVAHHLHHRVRLGGGRRGHRDRHGALSGGSSPTGTITFNLFGPNDARLRRYPGLHLDGRGTAGNGSYVRACSPPRRSEPTSGPPARAATPANNAVASGCGAANESVVVTKANTTVMTQASAPVTVGGDDR